MAEILTMDGWNKRAAAESFDQIFKAGTEVTEGLYDYFIGCVPPAIMTGSGFLVGEASRHTRQNVPMYSGFIRFKGRYYFAGEFTKAEFLKSYGGGK